MPPYILLLGGIGSGKTLAGEFLGRLGAFVISADLVARDVRAPGTEATAQVLDLWPEAGSAGVVERGRLGRIVFSDPAALARLESITHPETRRRILDLVARHPDETVVVEMPILRDWFDEGWRRVVVDAPDELRVARALERAGDMTESDVREIMARQPTRAEWLLAADFVLDNSGTPRELERACERLWERVHSA